jgi:hypothetical protein
MSKAYDELTKQLKEKKKLKPEDIEKVEKEHGKMTEEEKVKLAAEMHEQEKQEREGKEITVEQYLEASKTLDSAKEGSDEYKKAKKIVDAFESAA